MNKITYTIYKTKRKTEIMKIILEFSRSVKIVMIDGFLITLLCDNNSAMMRIRELDMRNKKI